MRKNYQKKRMDEEGGRVIFHSVYLIKIDKKMVCEKRVLLNQIQINRLLINSFLGIFSDRVHQKLYKKHKNTLKYK